MFLGDIRMAAMALRRWGEDPPATDKARRQEHARALMCSPVSRLPFNEMASPDLVINKNVIKRHTKCHG